MIREIYIVTSIGRKIVCETSEDAEKLAKALDADIETVPYIPSYGYSKLRSGDVNAD